LEARGILKKCAQHRTVTCTFTDMIGGPEDAQILVIDDDPGVLIAARLALSPHVGQVTTMASPDGAPDLLASQRIDLILMDMNFTPGVSRGQEGLDWLDRLRSIDPAVSLVLMTAYGGVVLAVETLKRGAVDFVLKPWRNEKLVATVTAGAALTRARRESRDAKLRSAEFGVNEGVLIGAAPGFQHALKLIERAAPTDAPVLLMGESGSGKSAVAREIHRASRRARAPFVAVDLGAIAESGLESELFGHRRGACAGATSDRAGRIQGAQGGTLFLDEIGLSPLHVQRKLMSVIERGEVTPLGATKPMAVDVRLISATNMSLEQLGRDEVFRQDLLLRLKAVEILLPPLRRRREDVALLMEHFLAHYARKHSVPRRRLSPEALRLLEAHDWPGNVRELSHAAERATILGEGERLEPEDFPLAFANSATEREQFDLDEIEKRTIGRAMIRFNGNISLAAAALGLTRPALYRRLQKHGL